MNANSTMAVREIKDVFAYTGAMSLFARPAKPDPAAAVADPGLARLSNSLRTALEKLAAAWEQPKISLAGLDTPSLEAWVEGQESAVAMDVFAPASDHPAAVLILPAALARTSTGQSLLQAFHQTVSGLLCAGDSWYVPHALDKAGLKDLVWQMADWTACSLSGGAGSLVLMLSAAAPKQAARPSAAAPANAATPGLRIPVLEPGEFHLARLFLPLTMRRADMTIRCRVRALRWRPAGEATPVPAAGAAPDALYAVRWTLSGEHLVFWLQVPAAIPPTIIRTLLMEGAATFKALSGASLELAGPVLAKALDPRLDLAELNYEVTARKQTAKWNVLIPMAVFQRLHKLFAEPWEMELLPQSGLSTLLSALALNRRLLNRGIAFSLAVPEAASEEDIACAIYDRIDALPEHDLTIVVQNHLVPRGTDAVLDCFFPRGGFDPLVWNRVTHALGEKLTLPLAQAIKEGKNKDSGLSRESLQELVKAVNGGRLDLSLRGKRLIGSIIGGMLDAVAKKELQPLMDAGLPGVLLARLPAPDRMKALTEMVDRERLIAFFGQRDHVLTLMEGFSSKGKERALEDFDVLVKAWERGEVPSSLVIFAKNEACCFIARHLAVTQMNGWPDAEWKKLQNELKAEDLLFLLQESEASCFFELPLQAKLRKGLSKENIEGLQIQVANLRKSGGGPARLPALIHRDLAERLLAVMEADEVIPASKPKPPPPKPRR